MRHLEELPAGVYRVRRRKLRGPGYHYGVLSISILTEGLAEVVDLGRDGLALSGFEEWAHGKKVEVVGRCPRDEVPLALSRLQKAVDEDRGYHLWRNNCEHFATWVVDGVHSSAQVKGVADFATVAGITVLVAGGIALLIVATRD